MRTVELDDETAATLAEVAGATGSSETELMAGAVAGMHRALIGVPVGPGGPQLDAGPFVKVASDHPAEIVLRQVDPTQFQLEETIRYRRADGPDWTIPVGDVTDLASVPPFLTWLVPRYGRHSLAALLHDYLQKQEGVTSGEADAIFRSALAATTVPLVRRWILWTAVSLRTRWKGGLGGRLAAAGWAGLHGMLGLAAFPIVLAGADEGWWTWFALLLAPAAIAAGTLVLLPFWRRSWRFALVSSVTLAVVTLPTLAVLLASGGYLLAERIAGIGRQEPPMMTRNLRRAVREPCTPSSGHG